MEQANFTTAEHRNGFRIIMKWAPSKGTKQKIDYFSGYTTEMAAEYGIVLLKAHISSWAGSPRHCLSSFPIERDLEGPSRSKKTARIDVIEEPKQFYGCVFINQKKRATKRYLEYKNSMIRSGQDVMLGKDEWIQRFGQKNEVLIAEEQTPPREELPTRNPVECDGKARTGMRSPDPEKRRKAIASALGYIASRRATLEESIKEYTQRLLAMKAVLTSHRCPFLNMFNLQ